MLVYESCLFGGASRGKLSLQIGTVFYTDDYTGDREIPVELKVSISIAILLELKLKRYYQSIVHLLDKLEMKMNMIQ